MKRKRRDPFGVPESETAIIHLHLVEHRQSKYRGVAFDLIKKIVGGPLRLCGRVTDKTAKLSF